MSERDVVLRETADRIATITVNRPDKLNALNRNVIERLIEEVEAVTADDDVGVVIVTGAGPKAFVAGADIAEMADLGPEEARAFARRGQQLGRLIDESGKPFIAAIQGFALGGGCELAMACHLRVAGPKARFGQPEVQLGLIPGFGGTQRLSRLVGEARALEMVLTGGMVNAAKAEAWGLVNRVAGEGEEAIDVARAMAGEILSKGPVAVRLCIEAVRKGLQMPLEESLEFEAALFGLTFATEDMREGTKAFVEKRAPDFKGR